MIANAAIGMGADDAYCATRELREAVEAVHEDVAGGKRKLTAILGNTCDDFQRCLFYALAGRGVVEMVEDLLWLEQLLEARGRIAGILHRKQMPQAALVSSYVAPEPDGPVGKFDEDFRIGPSWWLQPGMEYDGTYPFD